MKKIFPWLVSVVFFIAPSIFGQSVETFENETANSTTFTSDGQSFTLESGSNDVFSIAEVSGYGWNAAENGFDDKYIDNLQSTSTNDGSSFSIKTTDGADIYIYQLYLLVGLNDDTLATEESITIEGKKDGNTVYTIVKTSGFATDFQTSNGFTKIDLTTENGTNNAITQVDELVFTSSSGADYLALDYLVWSTNVLSVDHYENTVAKLFLNTSSSRIEVSGLNQKNTFKIYNVIGTEVKRGTVSNNESIDINSLKKGVYFLLLDSGSRLKFLKE